MAVLFREERYAKAKAVYSEVGAYNIYAGAYIYIHICIAIYIYMFVCFMCVYICRDRERGNDSISGGALRKSHGGLL